MARRSIVDDSEWIEVKYINGYAVFMGYLMMGVRGLGILVITWTTVVLLGGFVSYLGMQDFWCLTGIMLVQTAGVFNIILAETMSDLVSSWWGLLGTAAATVPKPFSLIVFSSPHTLLAFFLSGIQALVLVIVLCPVAVLYVFGIYISAGVGLWRLIEHDFGNADGAANLKPALEVLYSLAVAQGVIFGYKAIHAFRARFRLARFFAEQLESADKDLVSDYLEDTVEGCQKDPSFATGRNLVTYAVDLMMDAKSNYGFISGVKILGAAIVEGSLSQLYTINRHGRMVLAKHLLTRPSSSCSRMIKRLLETLGPRSPYSGKIREQAARIVAIVASSIHLEEHPGWINHISSVLETFEEYSWRPEEYERDRRLPEEYERDWLLVKYERVYWYLNGKRTKSTVTSSNLLREDYRRLVCQGFNILQELAVHQDNCRVIINTEGLLLKIMAPLYSNQPHRDHHNEWATIAKESLKLMMQLAVIPGETGTKLRGEISRSRKAIIITLEGVLECLECDMFLKIITVKTLLHLSVDSSSMKASGSSGRIFTWILLLTFLLPEEEVGSLYTRMEYSSDSRILSCENLSSILGLPLQQSVGFVLGDLTAALVGAGDISTRVHAAKILDHLCSWYRMDDEYLEELKKATVDVMPKVLEEILGRGSTGEAVEKAANNVQSSLQDIDLEIGGVLGGEGCEQTGDETEDIKLRKELTHLCGAIEWRWYGRNPDVTRYLDEIAGKVCWEQGKPVKTFVELLQKMEYL